MTLDTPVVLIIYRRPDLTDLVFRAIANAKPKTLLIVADGPRFPEEAAQCERAREVLHRVDWDCNVLTDFSEKNLGAKLRPSSGLKWVFSQVEEAIILEDDCVPAPSFFHFCQTLLDHYRHDERVMEVGGCNFQLGQVRTDWSYYFSKYAHTWGWATWRRAWRHFDEDIPMWPSLKRGGILRQFCDDAYEERYWAAIFDEVFAGQRNTCWDYQWQLAMWSQNGLSIVPETNLVSNVGFRRDGTHTRYESQLANLPTRDIWDIRHPSYVFRNRQADKYEFECAFGGKNTWSAQIRRGLGSAKRAMKRRVRMYPPRSLDARDT
jgi:hypothetical protein